MKSSSFSIFSRVSQILRHGRLPLAASAMMITLTIAQAGTSTAPAAPADSSEASNWITFAMGGAFVSGDKSGMMARTQTNGDFYGGISSLQYSKAINDSTTVTLDGHALPGLEDYEFNLNLTKNDVGYLKAGYKQFRTWYDGTGGFLQGVKDVTPAWGDELSIDRGEFYVEGGLRMDKLPEVTFSYKHDFRRGQTDSLSWGEGIPGVNNVYKLAPALWDIDEKSDTFQLDVDHTIGNTDLGVGLVFEHYSYSDSRTNARGYVVTTPPATNSNAYRDIVETNDYSTNLFAGNIHSVTRFNDQIWLTAGFAYNSANTDTDGSTRSIMSGTPLYTGSRAEVYGPTSGGAHLSQIIGNLNLMWNPIPDLTITPSLRYEHEETDAASTNPFYLPQTPTVITLASADSDSGIDDTTGALDIRYTGFTDLVLYAKGQWGHTNENLTWRDTTAANLTPRSRLDDNIVTDSQQYSIGTNYYPMRGLSLSVQGLYSETDASYDPTGNAGTGTQKLGSQGMNLVMLEHDTQVEDVNLRVTWRPLSNLTLVTRYDFGQTQFYNRGTTWAPGLPGSSPSPANTYGLIESGKTLSSILSESVTWYPMERFYVQGTASFVWAHTDTNFTGVTHSDDNYFSGSLTAGYAIDDKTEITGSFTYYGANNYQAYVGSMGYGLNTQEYCASLVLKRQLTPNMIWSLSYAFMTSNTDPTPDQTGGYNDFTAQMVSTGLQIRF